MSLANMFPTEIRLNLQQKSLALPEHVMVNDPFWLPRHFNVSQDKPFQWFLKRLVDFTGSALILSAMLPFLLVIAVAIKLDSKGPIFFRQKRIGLNGQEFDMLKFRSMVIDAEAQLAKLLKYNETNEGMFKLRHDPRITRLGSFMRKYSIDELPQLINVLLGDMSLVGPRPPIPRELETYKKWHYVRFASMPGMTGMWQVSGRSNITDFDKVVELDYRYIANWNLFLDFKLLFKTIPVVLFAKNAA